MALALVESIRRVEEVTLRDVLSGKIQRPSRRQSMDLDDIAAAIDPSERTFITYSTDHRIRLGFWTFYQALDKGTDLVVEVKNGTTVMRHRQRFPGHSLPGYPYASSADAELRVIDLRNKIEDVYRRHS